MLGMSLVKMMHAFYSLAWQWHILCQSSLGSTSGELLNGNCIVFSRRFPLIFIWFNDCLIKISINIKWNYNNISMITFFVCQLKRFLWSWKSICQTCPDIWNILVVTEIVFINIYWQQSSWWARNRHRQLMQFF
jgi:hypothetical protein